MTKPLLAIRDLHVTLGGNPVLRGVNAELARGQVAAVIGMNGAGKTTLLRALLKEVPYTGEVRFYCGHDHSRPTPQHIGYVPQKLRIDANLPVTVLDLFGLALKRAPLFFGVWGGLRARAVRLLEVVDAPHLLDKPLERISGGELQRVLLALALEPQPELLLLDEPAAGIDFKMQEKFHDLIGKLNERLGLTMLLVSHDLSMVSQIAQHVLCLKDGRVECEGPPRAILDAEHLARTFGGQSAVYAHRDHRH